MIDLFSSTVICYNIETFIVHVEDQILTLRRFRYKENCRIIELTITARPIKPMSPLDKDDQQGWSH